MFDNIGRKIKTLAQVICVLGIIVSVIGGIILWITGGGLGFVISLVAIPISAVISWVGSLGLYGFGQLIENTDILVSQGENKHSKFDKSEKSDISSRMKQYNQNDSKQIEDDNFIGLYCPECGEKISFPKEYIHQKPFLVCPMCNARICSDRFKT